MNQPDFIVRVVRAPIITAARLRGPHSRPNGIVITLSKTTAKRARRAVKRWGIPRAGRIGIVQVMLHVIERQLDGGFNAGGVK